MVVVKLFAAAAQAAGTREISGAWERLTVQELLGVLLDRYPGLRPLEGSLQMAVNHEYVDRGLPLADGDEVALIPPVSGGSEPEDPGGEPLYEITEAPISTDRMIARLLVPEAGAVVTFVGTVREWTFGQRTVELEYEAYPAMAVKEMARIGREIAERWPGATCAISHRVGRLAIGEASVVIAVATPHRAAAFDACRHAIDRLKQIVPVWKRERWEDGEEWVGAQGGRHSKAPDAAQHNRGANR